MRRYAGAFGHQDSLLVFSWIGLLARGKTRTKRFLFTALRKHDYLPQILDAAFKIFAWSVNALLEGRFPTRNWDDVGTGNTG